jgi:hypothetical protein
MSTKWVGCHKHILTHDTAKGRDAVLECLRIGEVCQSYIRDCLTRGQSLCM